MTSPSPALARRSTGRPCDGEESGDWAPSCLQSARGPPLLKVIGAEIKSGSVAKRRDFSEGEVGRAEEEAGLVDDGSPPISSHRVSV